MKFLSKLTAIGLAFSLAAGLAGCQSSNAETTSSAADTTSAAASSESIPDLEVTIPLDDVTLRKPRKRLPNPRTLPKALQAGKAQPLRTARWI